MSALTPSLAPSIVRRPVVALGPTGQVASSTKELKTILLATDFSSNASTALDWAIELARVHKAHVAVVHAVETELPALAVPPGPIAQKVQQSLNDARKRVAQWDVTSSIEHYIGKPWNVVSAVAAKIDADLIVLGARGKTDFAGKLLGSTADRIIRTTSVPVMVIRDEARRPTAISTVLVASDFSEESARATSMAVRLLHNAESAVRLVLFHVVPLQIHFPDSTYPGLTHGDLPKSEYWNEIELQAARHLETLAAPLRSERVTVEAKTVRGFPGEEIVREAESIDAQLIAIGTQGRTGLNRFFMGSVAEWVLHHAKCRVLAVRKPHPADLEVH